MRLVSAIFVDWPVEGGDVEVERPGAGGGGGIATDARVLQRQVHPVVSGRLEAFDERILDPNHCNKQTKNTSDQFLYKFNFDKKIQCQLRPTRFHFARCQHIFGCPRSFLTFLWLFARRRQA